MTETGEYICLETTKYGLKFTLTNEGREYAEELEERPYNEIFDELFEDHYSNGWELLYPGEVPALTDADMLTDNAVRDDMGELVSVDHFYYDEHYQVRSTVQSLRCEGVVEWKRFRVLNY